MSQKTVSRLKDIGLTALILAASFGISILIQRGLDIGLSVCATIVKAHGGSITAENGKGGGAVFRFALPLEEELHE